MSSFSITNMIIGLDDTIPDTERYMLLIDPAESSYIYDETIFASEANFLTAINGTKTTDTYEIGNYVLDTAPDWIVNGDFSDGVNNWTVNQSSGAASGSVVSGEYQLDNNGAAYPRVVQSFPIEKGKAYRFEGQGRNISSNVNPRLMIAKQGESNPLASTGLLVSSALQSFNFGGVGNESYLDVLGYTQHGAATGVLGYDNFSVKECIPFKNFISGQLSGVIEATAPGDVSGTKVLLQIDPNEANAGVYGSYLYIAIENGNLLVRNRYRTDTYSQGNNSKVIAAISANESFKLQFAITANHLSYSYNDAEPVVHNIGTIPGVAFLRINGQKSAANAWGNDDTKLRVFKSFTLPDGVSLEFIALHGDSYGGVQGPLQVASGSVVLTTAVGGSTLQQVVDRALAATNLHQYKTVVWDGDNNGYDTVSAYMALWQQLKDTIGNDKIVAVPPIVRQYSSANADRLTIQAQMAAMFTHYVDAQQLLADANDGSAGDLAAVSSGYCPPSLLQSDQVHLNAAGYAAVIGNGVDDGGILHKLSQITL